MAESALEFAERLRAIVGPESIRMDGSAGTFSFAPNGDSMEFWSYSNATAYTGAVLEILRLIDPDREWFTRATKYHNGQNNPRTWDEAVAAVSARENSPATHE